MVTDRPGLALGIVTADCAPVLFADADRRIVGAAHAGWRGAVAGVLEATIAAMTALGASPDRITAAVGPCIAQASYEVGPDLRDAVLARSADDAAFFAPGQQQDRWQFDLPGYCAARLTAAGVGHVIVTGFDTLAEEDRFFSYRRRTLAQARGRDGRERRADRASDFGDPAGVTAPGCGAPPRAPVPTTQRSPFTTVASESPFRCPPASA